MRFASGSAFRSPSSLRATSTRVGLRAICVSTLALAAASAQAQGASDVVEVREGSAVELYVASIVNGEVQEPGPAATPVDTSHLSGSGDIERDGSIWTVTTIDAAAEDVDFLGLLSLSDITITMPFSGVPDPFGTPQTMWSLTGIDDGSVLVFDDGACAACTDFGASLNYTLSGAPNSLALIGPIELNLGTEGGHTTLGTSVNQGLIVNTGLADIGVWIRGQVELITVPEPSLRLLQSAALLATGLLAYRRRRHH